MTDMTPSQAAQQNNRDGAGQYAPKAHAESGVDITYLVGMAFGTQLG